MRNICLIKKPLNSKDFLKRFALDSDYSELIKESFIGKEGEQIKIVYLNLDWDTSDLVRALRLVDYNKSKRVAGLITNSAIFGYTPRRIIYADYCRTADMSYRHPEHHSKICSYASKVSEVYRQYNPALYEAHKQKTDSVKPGWKLLDTPFTSGIANKDNQLKYHFDSGNFKGTWSAMLAFRKDVDGGHLSIPEYGIGLEIANNSLLLFDGQSIMHGVTPIRKIGSDSYRISIVYYSLQTMWKCGEAEEELSRIKRVKTDREQRRAVNDFDLKRVPRL